MDYFCTYNNEAKQYRIKMRKAFLALFVTGMTCFNASAQYNMEAFRHISIGAEAGLHGLGVEIAMPIQKHLVLKAGYNLMPPGNLLYTDIQIDTKDFRQTQEEYDNTMHFQYKFQDKAIVNAGVQMGMANIKAMLNWYPVASGRFYFAGGVYYTPSAHQDDPFIEISGNVNDNDWAALAELNEKVPDPNRPDGKRELILATISGKEYALFEKDGHGHMLADFKMDPLKYYLGFGIGRCVPNGRLGLQLEAGAMVYHNSSIRCQNQEMELKSVGDSFGSDAEEILDYVDKYPIYPQVTLRLCFRVL